MPEAETPWWQDVVFYEIFVRSFKDSDGDGIGDFQGIISMLDYLNDGDPETDDDLEIGAIWLMPMMPSPSYHGYDVTDYFRVNPEYGTQADFEAFLAACHERGIRVIIDLVVNHTSDQHPWFQTAKTSDAGFHDWYVWSETDPGTLGPWGQDPWHKAENGKWYYGAFWGGMPDLNYHQPMVTKMMYQISKHWLDMGVDGFRVDAARYLYEEGVAMQDHKKTIAWFQNWRAFIKPINPEAFTVGEVWADLQVTAKYSQPKGLDSLFAFDLAEDIKGGVFAPSASRVIAAYQDALKAFPEGDFGSFLSNHDQQRVASYYQEKWGKAKQAAFIYLTGPGIPFIYYGEEIGLTGNKPDENLRTPMQWSTAAEAGFTTGTPWEPINADWPEKNVELQAADPESLFIWYRDLVNLRNDHPALRTGSYQAFISSCRSVYATLRVADSEILITMVNIGVPKQEDCTLTLEGSPLQGGEYEVEDLWGISQLDKIQIGEDGQITELPLAPVLQGGETFIIRLSR